jgi:hypothetical protein
MDVSHVLEHFTWVVKSIVGSLSPMCHIRHACYITSAGSPNVIGAAVECRADSFYLEICDFEPKNAAYVSEQTGF